MNPALLAKRIAALEQALERQFALCDAAAARLVQMQEELAQKGAFVVALLQRLGGRFEISTQDLAQLQESSLKVHFSYPDETRDTFVMVMAADGEPDDARIREVEAKLRAMGVSDAEIAALAGGAPEAPADPAPAAPEEGEGGAA